MTKYQVKRGGHMRIIDLTGMLENEMWDYGEPFIPYSIKRLSSLENDGYVASEVKLTTHTGTHVDCPRHFGEKRKSIENMNLENFFGQARLVDIADKCDRKKPITLEIIKNSEAQKLEKNEICVLRTGWEDMWGKSGFVDDYPYITPEAASYLVSKGIKLLATDIPIIGDPHDTVTDMILCEAEIPSIYALVNTRLLPENFIFVAFPLKLKGSDGSPVRAVALIDWEKGE